MWVLGLDCRIAEIFEWINIFLKLQSNYEAKFVEVPSEDLSSVVSAIVEMPKTLTYERDYSQVRVRLEWESILRTFEQLDRPFVVAFPR